MPFSSSAGISVSARISLEDIEKLTNDRTAVKNTNMKIYFTTLPNGRSLYAASFFGS